MISDMRRNRPFSEGTTIVLEIFLGIAAVVCGVLFVIRPNGSLLGMTVADLIRGPFSDFLVPGVLLALVIGLGMLGAAAMVIQRREHAWRFTVAAGLAMVAFETVEIVTVRFNPQQLIYGALGVAVALLGLRLRGLPRSGAAGGHGFAGSMRPTSAAVGQQHGRA